MWSAAERFTLGATEALVAAVGNDAVRLGGQADLVMVGQLARHLDQCTVCFRTWVGGRSPYQILRTQMRRRPLWDIYRAAETEAAARRRYAPRSGRRSVA